MSYKKNYQEALKFVLDGNKKLEESTELDACCMHLMDIVGEKFDVLASTYKGLSFDDRKKYINHLDEIQKHLSTYIDQISRLRDHAKTQINTVQAGKSAHKAYRIAQR